MRAPGAAASSSTSSMPQAMRSCLSVAAGCSGFSGMSQRHLQQRKEVFHSVVRRERRIQGRRGLQIFLADRSENPRLHDLSSRLLQPTLPNLARRRVDERQ